ncbi:hypothetical protein Tco_0758459, partial [Tanacetum coccineum]
IWDTEDVHDLGSVETEFQVIVLNDMLKSEAALSCEPTVSSLNDNQIDFRISFNESDDEDCTVIFDKNTFSYKIIYVNDLKTDSENDNDKVDMPSFLSPEPTVSYFNDLDYFNDFENEFPAIVYKDALTSKSYFLTEPTLSPQHINEFDLKTETSLSECNEEEQNVLYFIDLFPFNVIFLDDSKLDKDDDDDKIDIKEPSRGNVINTDDGAYAQGSNKLLETRTHCFRGHDNDKVDIECTLRGIYLSIDTAYSLKEYSVFDTDINTAYPGEWIRCIDFLYSFRTSERNRMQLELETQTAIQHTSLASKNLQENLLRAQLSGEFSFSVGLQGGVGLGKQPVGNVMIDRHIPDPERVKFIIKIDSLTVFIIGYEDPHLNEIIKFPSFRIEITRRGFVFDVRDFVGDTKGDKFIDGLWWRRWWGVVITGHCCRILGFKISSSDCAFNYDRQVLSRPTGYSISEDLKDEPIEEEPLEELKEEG